MRGVGRRVACLALLAVVGVAGYLSWGSLASAGGPDTSELTGRWLRSDGSYVLELDDPAPGGGIDAAYHNPNPINVSRAEWKQQDGVLGVFVELRDVGYPGSTYALAYDPEGDRLVGVYFQAVLREQFVVEFIRAE
jgi:hypothetical protein